MGCRPFVRPQLGSESTTKRPGPSAARLRLSLQDRTAEVREAAALALGYHAAPAAIVDLTDIDGLVVPRPLAAVIGGRGDRQRLRTGDDC